MMLTREGFVISVVVFEDTERERKAWGTLAHECRDGAKAEKPTPSKAVEPKAAE